MYKSRSKQRDVPYWVISSEDTLLERGMREQGKPLVLQELQRQLSCSLEAWMDINLVTMWIVSILMAQINISLLLILNFISDVFNLFTF
jgi:hypothetical protein